MSQLLDTGFLYALLNRQESRHQDVLDASAKIHASVRDSNFDFVDAILVAIAERLNITLMLTIDTRHFRMFRPNHCPAFEILP